MISIINHLMWVFHCRSSIICIALPVFYYFCPIAGLLSLVSICPSSIAISIIEHPMWVFHRRSFIICNALPVFYHLYCIAGLLLFVLHCRSVIFVALPVFYHWSPYIICPSSIASFLSLSIISISRSYVPEMGIIELLSATEY